jgi:hypothetical protein
MSNQLSKMHMKFGWLTLTDNKTLGYMLGQIHQQARKILRWQCKLKYL